MKKLLFLLLSSCILTQQLHAKPTNILPVCVETFVFPLLKHTGLGSSGNLKLSSLEYLRVILEDLKTARRTLGMPLEEEHKRIFSELTSFVATNGDRNRVFSVLRGLKKSSELWFRSETAFLDSSWEKEKVVYKAFLGMLGAAFSTNPPFYFFSDESGGEIFLGMSMLLKHHSYYKINDSRLEVNSSQVKFHEELWRLVVQGKAGKLIYGNPIKGIFENGASFENSDLSRVIDHVETHLPETSLSKRALKNTTQSLYERFNESIFESKMPLVEAIENLADDTLMLWLQAHLGEAWFYQAGGLGMTRKGIADFRKEIKHKTFGSRQINFKRIGLLSSLEAPQNHYTPGPSLNYVSHLVDKMNFFAQQAPQATSGAPHFDATLLRLMARISRGLPISLVIFRKFGLAWRLLSTSSLIISAPKLQERLFGAAYLSEGILRILFEDKRSADELEELADLLDVVLMRPYSQQDEPFQAYLRSVGQIDLRDSPFLWDEFASLKGALQERFQGQFKDRPIPLRYVIAPLDQAPETFLPPGNENL